MYDVCPECGTGLIECDLEKEWCCMCKKYWNSRGKFFSKKEENSKMLNHSTNAPRINRVIIGGNAVEDAKKITFGSGEHVVKIRIASDFVYKDDSTNEWKKITTFVSCSAWGYTGNRALERVKKGAPLLIEGNLKTRKFVDKEENVREILEINANKIHYLERDSISKDAFTRDDLEYDTFPLDDNILCPD